MKLENIEINWLGHAGFLFKFKNKHIYIDPYKIQNKLPKADLILLTHSHYDHCSLDDIVKINDKKTQIIATEDCVEQLPNIKPIRPYEKIKLEDISIIALPAYNQDKEFHPKEKNWVGYLISFENILIYHAGDTDLIPEMSEINQYKKQGQKLIAFLPIGGKFTMNPEEGSRASNIINPDLAIPMHYNTIIGTDQDAAKFLALCKQAGIKCSLDISTQDV